MDWLVSLRGCRSGWRDGRRVRAAIAQRFQISERSVHLWLDREREQEHTEATP